MTEPTIKNQAPDLGASDSVEASQPAQEGVNQELPTTEAQLSGHEQPAGEAQPDEPVQPQNRPQPSDGPATGADSSLSSLNIIIRNGAQQQLHFKIKPTTKLSKVTRVFCEQTGSNRQHKRFLFDGTPINDNDTALTLEMVDGDIIECVQEQVGGSDLDYDFGASMEGVLHRRGSASLTTDADVELGFGLPGTSPAQAASGESYLFDGVANRSSSVMAPPRDTGPFSVTDDFYVKSMHDNNVNAAGVSSPRVAPYLPDPFLATSGFGRPTMIKDTVNICGSRVFNGPGTMQPAKGKIEVMVRSQHGAMIAFHVRPTTRLGKVMEAFCTASKALRASYRFLFDGMKVRDNDTPASLDLRHGDVIEVYSEQTGGSRV